MTPVQTIETEGGIGSFADWIQRNSRWVLIGAILVVLGGVGLWFYVRSAEIKRANAERGLTQAKQSMAAGNPALAETDLQRVANRYPGTPAGVQAALMLAGSRYDQGKFAEGLQALESYQNPGAAGASLAAIWSMTADGQMGLNQPEAAAASYEKAADATEMQAESAFYRAKGAKALMAAGKLDEARNAWQELLDDPRATSVHSEAQIRLGELTAKTAGQS